MRVRNQSRFERYMRHEAQRWGYMTQRELATRVKKITNDRKLVAFIKYAQGVGNCYLEKMARQRLLNLGFKMSTYVFV